MRLITKKHQGIKSGITLSLIVVMLLSMVTLGACGTNPEQLIRDAVTEELEEIKVHDASTIDTILGDASLSDDLSQMGLTQEEFFNAWLEGFDYSVGDITVEGDSAVVVVNIKVKSLMAAQSIIEEKTTELIQNADASATEEDLLKEVGQIMITALNETDVSETTVELGYDLIDNTWTPNAQFNSELAKVFGS